jgi:hypothetical protein
MSSSGSGNGTEIRSDDDFLPCDEIIVRPIKFVHTSLFADLDAFFRTNLSAPASDMVRQLAVRTQ